MSSKLFKSVLINFLFIGLCLFIGLILLHEYKSTGCIRVKYLDICGEDAKTTSHLILLVTFSALGYFVFLVIRTFANPEKRRYYTTKTGKKTYFICSKCQEIVEAENSDGLSCPKCNNTKMEELSGFYKRHPDKVEEIPHQYLPATTESVSPLRGMLVAIGFSFLIAAMGFGIALFSMRQR